MDKEVMDILKAIQYDIKGLKEDMGVLKQDVSVLKDDVGLLKQDVNVLKDDVGLLKQDVSLLKDGQERIEGKVDSIDDKLSDLEPVNANRHLEIINNINAMKKDITNVEIITSSNWNDIAKLKAVK